MYHTGLLTLVAPPGMFLLPLVVPSLPGPEPLDHFILLGLALLPVSGMVAFE